MASQWRFPLDALRQTPSGISLEEEMVRRQRGVDWLMRVGATLGIGLGPCLTAATFLHRFYMRRMLEDYHEYEIAATCLFLASKTEENGKRLEDLVTVALAKLHSVHPSAVAGKFDAEAKRLETCILTYEEVLLEVLCFDFDVQHPHASLADVFANYYPDPSDESINHLIECVWSVAHDSYRTPLCLLESPQVIAAAIFLFAQCLADGPNGPSLDDRLTNPRPNDPDWKHLFELSDSDTQDVAVSLVILCQYYNAFVPRDNKPDITAYKLVQPPTVDVEVPTLFSPATITNGVKDGSKTPAGDLKSIPATPLPPTGGSTPITSAAS